jgi:outer membrane receptor protein involved in Fe transport
MGLDGVLNRVHLRIFNEEHSTANAATEADSEGLTTNVKSPSGNLAGYALADYRLGRTTLSGGLRDDYVRIPFQNLLNVEDRTTNSYSHLNPRFGASVDLGRGALAYASVGESFRAPAILELSCADPTAACPLPFALGDDPPLSPVVARTYEAGARWIGGSMLLSASLYRTDMHDEIFFVTSEHAALSGYFRNLDRTRREGAEIAASGAAIDGRLEWFANYAYTRATFQSPAQLFSVRSEDDFRASPFAGQNDVMPGDRLPLVPAHQAKAGASFHGGRTSLGLDARYVGPQWLRGDEANETRPLGGFAIFDVRGSVDVRNWEIGATINNLFDMRRASFGTFNENRLTGDLERFFTPISPRTVSVSLRRALGAQEAR